MSSTSPRKCLVCENEHEDEMQFISCEAAEMFEVFLEMGSLNQATLDSLRRKYEGY